MESILTSIKKLLGIDEDDTSFDTDVIIHINSAFMILTQLGVGPSEGFSISDETAVWTDFISDTKKIEAVKTYTHLRVKLIFDPPTSAFVTAAIETQIKEIEWRINVAVETPEE